jgi:hypothetical protein
VRLGLVIAATVLVAAPALAHADRTVRGTVVDAKTSEPIAGAEVSADGLDTVAGDDGTFLVSGVPAGSFDIFAIADGYEPYLGRAGAGQVIVIRLSRDESGAEVVHIEGTAPVIAEPATAVGPAEITTLPGSGNDALRSLQSLPGVARIPFGLGGLALRGAAPRDTHVYLDDIEVPILYHFGGLASFVPTGFISNLELEPGSFGVRYGRGVGGIALVTSRTPPSDKWRVGGEVSLLDAAATATGPGPDKGGLSFGVRRSYADFILGQVPIDLTLVPRYLDAQARWESGDSKWTALTFVSDDSLHLIRTPGGSGAGGLDTSSLAAFDYGSEFLRSGVRYRTTLGHGDFAPTLVITPSLGADSISALANNKGEDKGESRTTYEGTLRAELTQPIDGGAIRVGADATLRHYDWDVDDVPPPSPADPNPMTIVDRKGHLWTEDAGAWLELAWASPDDGFGVRPGVRVDYFGLADQWTIDPRLTISHRGPRCSTITESIGIYHQGPSIVDYDPAFRQPGVNDLGASWATQASIGVKAPLRDVAQLSVTAYGSDMHELPVDVITGATPISANGGGEAGGIFGIARELIDDQFGSYTYRENRGRGVAYGIETMVRKDTGDVTGWISYTYARSLRKGDPETHPDWLPYVLDQPHLFTAVASWRRGDHWRFGGRFRVTSGNPYTPVAGSYLPQDTKQWHVIDGPLLSSRLPFFMQLDLRVDRIWIRKWGRIDFFLDLQNVTNRANPEGITYNEDYTHLSYTLGLPIFPSFGVEYIPP